MLSRDGPQGLTEEDARSRLASQWPLSKKLPYADIVLDNSSAISGSESSSGRTGHASEALEAQVTDMVRGWQRSYSGLVGTLWWLAQWLCPPFTALTAGLAILERRASVARRLREAEESDRQGEERRSMGSQ